MCDIFSSLVLVGSIATTSDRAVELQSVVVDCRTVQLEASAGHYESIGDQPLNVDKAELKLRWKLW